MDEPLLTESPIKQIQQRKENTEEFPVSEKKETKFATPNLKKQLSTIKEVIVLSENEEFKSTGKKL